MVQTWVDNGDANPAPGSVNAPFVSVPPLFSLAPQRMQGIRLIYNQSPLPKDRESVFWLNVYEIPPGLASAFFTDAERGTDHEYANENFLASENAGRA